MERSITPKQVYKLLIIGGAIVAATFVVGWILGVGTWDAWWVANGLHVLGGAYAFYFTRAIFLYTKPYHQTSAAPWMEIVIFIGGAIILGVFWEWFEFSLDRWSVLVKGKASTMTYPDNIGDLILDTFGATVAAWYFLKKKIESPLI